VKKVVVGIFRALVILLYRICSLFPEKNRIVCLSRQTNETPRDFALIHSYIEEHDPDWEVVILAKTLDNPLKYLPHIFKQIRFIATSRMVVLDSYCIAVCLLGNRISAPVLQMWHALGNMKQFGYMTLDTPEGRSSKDAKIWHMHEGYDSVLVSSMSFADDLAAGFNVSPSILYEAPLPRVDLYISPENKRREQKRAIQAIPELANGKKNIVYCPTFRRIPAPNEKEAMQSLVDAIDFSKYNLIFKRHPVSKQRIEDSRVIQDYPQSVNPLYCADYAISDYSTVIYEAGLLKIPLFLYAYDWDTYAQKRSLNIDIEHAVPTLFTDDPKLIAAAIRNDSFDVDAYEGFVLENISIPTDGNCTKRVVDHIFSMIGHREKHAGK
jgi:CDP-ribitol ribitolphosphotransferase